MSLPNLGYITESGVSPPLLTAMRELSVAEILAFATPLGQK
jgi:hypothetical protein